MCLCDYPFGKKGWRLYDLESKVFFVPGDVKFIEDVFPFATSKMFILSLMVLSCLMIYMMILWSMRSTLTMWCMMCTMVTVRIRVVLVTLLLPPRRMRLPLPNSISPKLAQCTGTSPLTPAERQQVTLWGVGFGKNFPRFFFVIM